MPEIVWFVQWRCANELLVKYCKISWRLGGQGFDLSQETNTLYQPYSKVLKTNQIHSYIELFISLHTGSDLHYQLLEKRK